MKILSEEQLAGFLAEEPLWSLAGGMLVREWEFPAFVDAIAFVGRVAELAEQRDHHPDIDIRYRKVRLALSTHAAHGITGRDTGFARAVGEI